MTDNVTQSSARYECSIVVPVYNSQESLPLLLAELAALLPTIMAAYEVILVNDGSRDKSWLAVEKLATEYPWVSGINLMRNYGQHNAILCGTRVAQYPLIITMDDDLEHPPSEIPKLLAKLSEGYDVVYGAPVKQTHGFLRDLASSITKFVLQQSMGAQVARNVSAFRIFRTQLRDAFQGVTGPFVSIDVMLTWGTIAFGVVQVRHDERLYGVSNYNVQKLIIHAFNMMTGFTIRPLQMATFLGFSFAFFGVLVFIYAIVGYIINHGSVPGFTFLASIIAIFSGIQLFSLGIIGEYLARIHFRTAGRPTYVVRECTPNISAVYSTTKTHVSSLKHDALRGKTESF